MRLRPSGRDVRALRDAVTEAIEPLRREKTVRSSLEAEVTVPDAAARRGRRSPKLFIVAQGRDAAMRVDGDAAPITTNAAVAGGICPRLTTDGALCDRCDERRGMSGDA